MTSLITNQRGLKRDCKWTLTWDWNRTGKGLLLNCFYVIRGIKFHAQDWSLTTCTWRCCMVACLDFIPRIKPKKLSHT